MPKSISRAKLVRKERESRAWPQSQLAEIANLSTRTIQRLERDGTAASETLMAVADALELDVQLLTSAKTKKNSELQKQRIHHLRYLKSGQDIGKLIWGSDRFQLEHDDIDNPKVQSMMNGFLNLLKDDLVVWHDGDLSAKFEVETAITEGIKELEKFGFCLFGTKRSLSNPLFTPAEPITLCTIFLTHKSSPKIVHDKNSRMTLPAKLTETAPKEWANV